MMKKFFPFLILIFPIALILPSLGMFAFPPGSPYSDLAITHLPNVLFLKHSIATWHQIPLWSDLILSGYPFAADPLSGLWYLPGWLAVVLPEPFGFNLLIVLHLLLGGIGLFIFLRSEQLDELPALLGAFTFELMPKLFAHFASGHITLLFAVMWTPWLLWVEKKKIVSSARKYFFLAGIILGVIVLADVRWIAYAFLVWIAFSFYSARINPLRLDRLLPWIRQILATGLIACLIAAPLVLPLIEFTRLSTRSLLQPADNLMLSLAPAQLLGLFIPQFWGYSEDIVYPGAIAILLFLAVVCLGEARRKSAFWIGVVVAVIIFSLGANIPGSYALARLPGLSLLRVPTRWLFVACLAFSILAAYGADALSRNGYRKLARPNPTIFYVGLSAFILFLAAGVWVISKDLPISFLWSAIFFPVLTVLIVLRVYAKISVGWWFPLIFGLVILDMGSISLSQVSFQDAATVMGMNKQVADFLNQQVGTFRVYSPSYSIPQQVGSLANIQLADGIDPLQLTAYVNFMKEATGVPSEGYSVTLPPFSTGNPLTANQAYLPDAVQLGLLNVRYVTAEYDLASQGLDMVARFGETRIYENKQVKPRAWVQRADMPVGDGIISTPVAMITPNKITLTALGPGLLVLSEINYPDWAVRVDNLNEKIVPVAGILRGVDLPAGKHTVTFTYEPVLLLVGLALAATGWIGMLILVLRTYLKIKKPLFYIQKPTVFEYKKVKFPNFRIDNKGRTR